MITLSYQIIYILCFRSKLHLVDLAGSERAGKSTGDEKNIESRHANLSLDHLDAVVTALLKVPLKRPCSSTSTDDEPAAITRSLRSCGNVDGDGDARKLSCYKSTKSLSDWTKHAVIGQDNSIPYRDSLLTMVLQEMLGEHLRI